MSEPLTQDQLDKLLPALSHLAELIKRKGDLEREEIGRLLIASDLDEPWAVDELVRWKKVLTTARADPDPGNQEILQRSLILRGVPEANALHAVHTVCQAQVPQSSPSVQRLSASVERLTFVKMQPGQPVQTVFDVSGGAIQSVRAENDCIQTTYHQLGGNSTRVEVFIRPMPGASIMSFIQILAHNQVIDVPIYVEWEEEKAYNTEPLPSVPPREAKKTGTKKTKASSVQEPKVRGPSLPLQANSQIFGMKFDTSAWKVTLIDHFADNTNGWLIGKEQSEWGDFTWRAQDGHYGWEARVKQACVKWSIPNIKAATDVYLSVRARQIIGPLTSEFGLIFAMDEKGENFYLFEINNQSQFRFLLFRKPTWETLVAWQSCAAQPSQAMSLLEVLAQDGQFILAINGHMVQLVQDQRLKRGKAGIVVGLSNANDQGEWVFEDFQMLIPTTGSDKVILAKLPLKKIPTTKPDLSGKEKAASTQSISKTPAQNSPGQKSQVPATHSYVYRSHWWKEAELWPVVISDEFNNNVNSWVLGNYSGDLREVSFQLKTGEYILTAMAKLPFIQPTTLNLAITSNFYLAVNVRQIYGPQDARCGLVFFQDVKSENYYLFEMNNQGKFGIQIFYRKTWERIIDWQKDDALRPGESNLLEVVSHAGMFRFAINQIQVAHIDDKRLLSGKVGISIGLDSALDRGQWAFDNFKVCAPEYQSLSILLGKTNLAKSPNSSSSYLDFTNNQSLGKYPFLMNKRLGRRKLVCSQCGGEVTRKDCPECGGSGKKFFFFTCEYCDGSGNIYNCKKHGLTSIKFNYIK